MADIQQLTEKVTNGIKRHIYGHDAEARLLLAAFAAGGHVLLEGPPGVAKTLLAKTIAGTLGLSFSRIQFTPDLMPSDITGVNVFDPRNSTFVFNPGPLFAQLVLADEINRTPPKTQAALLEAMEERQVTVDGTRRDLGELFFVIATQNPIEHEGTFPLPEAQLDRFFFKLNLGYPSAELEQQMIVELSSAPAAGKLKAEPVIDAASLQEARVQLRNIALSPSIARYITGLTGATRSNSLLLLGASPRASLHLAIASKALALLDGRNYVLPDDVQAAFLPVLSHRVVLHPEAFEQSTSAAAVLRTVLAQEPVPAA